MLGDDLVCLFYTTRCISHVQFDSLDDPLLLQYVEDSIYANLADQFDSEDYDIEIVESFHWMMDLVKED